MRISPDFKMFSPKYTLCPWLTTTGKRHKATENFIMTYVLVKQKCRTTSGTSWMQSEPNVWIDPLFQVKAHENHGPKNSPLFQNCDIESCIPATYTFLNSTIYNKKMILHKENLHFMTKPREFHSLNRRHVSPYSLAVAACPLALLMFIPTTFHKLLPHHPHHTETSPVAHW